jgi:hypothetical protein
MQTHDTTSYRLRRDVLAAPSDVVVDTLLAQPEQWFRIAGCDYCRNPEEHIQGCRCAVRTLTQTAYRVREGDLGAFAGVRDGCFEARALSAADRPDKLYDVEIKARWVQHCA